MTSGAAERLQAVLETAADGIISIDVAGTILSVNPATERLFGYGAEELISHNVSMLMPEPFASAHDGYLASYLKTGKAKIIGIGREIVALRKDGKTFPATLAVSEVNINNERTFTGFIRNISEQYERDKELRAAIEKADIANRVKSEFLSSMSHELRTPLNAIIGFSQLMSMDPDLKLTETQDENLRNISNAGHHLLGLVNDVLEFAKIEAGAVSVTLESVPVIPVIAESMDMLASRAARRGITLEPDELMVKKNHLVRADATRLKQCLTNLLSNAVKYSHENGHIRVEVEDVDDGNQEIRVTDTGSGIDEDRYLDVFTPFSRLGWEESSVEGAGIGLSITQRLMALMQGTCGFSSVPGKGSTFWLRLLRLPRATSANIQGERDQIKDSLHQLLAEMETLQFFILYVEDNPANMEVMRQIINMLPGGDLIVANSAELGISFAEDRQPGMIIMDINLPGMSGIQGLDKLRENPITRGIPVVALSANALPDDVQRGIDAGFDAYLTKPVQVIQGLETIMSTLTISP